MEEERLSAWIRLTCAITPNTATCRIVLPFMMIQPRGSGASVGKQHASASAHMQAGKLLKGRDDENPALTVVDEAQSWILMVRCHCSSIYA